MLFDTSTEIQTKERKPNEPAVVVNININLVPPVVKETVGKSFRMTEDTIRDVIDFFILHF